MPILALPPEPAPTPPPDADTVAAVMEIQRAHCAKTTWDRFVKSLTANGFPYPTTR